MERGPARRGDLVVSPGRWGTQRSSLAGRFLSGLSHTVPSVNFHVAATRAEPPSPGHLSWASDHLLPPMFSAPNIYRAGSAPPGLQKVNTTPSLRSRGSGSWASTAGRISLAGGHCGVWFRLVRGMLGSSQRLSVPTLTPAPHCRHCTFSV